MPWSDESHLLKYKLVSTNGYCKGDARTELETSRSGGAFALRTIDDGGLALCSRCFERRLVEVGHLRKEPNQSVVEQQGKNTNRECSRKGRRRMNGSRCGRGHVERELLVVG